jgi:hypothetical protein
MNSIETERVEALIAAAQRMQQQDQQHSRADEAVSKKKEHER